MTDTTKDDTNPLLDPTELAGTADAAIAAEFAARDAMEALDEAEGHDAVPSEDLPLDGEQPGRDRGGPARPDLELHQ